jgi:hypothetical protein
VCALCVSLCVGVWVSVCMCVGMSVHVLLCVSTGPVGGPCELSKVYTTLEMGLTKTGWGQVASETQKEDSGCGSSGRALAT